MPRLKQYGFGALSLLVAVPTLVAAPAFAQRGSDDATETNTVQVEDSPKPPQTVQTQESGGSSGRRGGDTTRRTRVEDNPNRVEAENETEHGTEAEAGRQRGRDELRQSGKDLVAELKKEHGAKTADELKQECNKRKDKLSNRVVKIVRVTKNIQGRVDAVYTKAAAYQDEKALTSDELTSLKAAAETSKATIATSVANLEALQPTIDCDATNNAEEVAAFQAAAKTAKTDLKSYKSAVKAYVLALKAATPATTSTEDQQ